MNSTLIARIKAAHVELGPTPATWWVGEKGAWKEAPGRPPPPHKVSSSWPEFVGAVEEASRLDLKTKGDGPHFVLATMDRGYRGKAHVEAVHGLTIDIDNARTDVSALRAWVESTGLAWVMQVRGGKAHVHFPVDRMVGRERFLGAARVFLGEVGEIFPGVDLNLARPEQPCFVYARVGGGGPVATLSGAGYALDLSEWCVPGALGVERGERLPGRGFLLDAGGQWEPGEGLLDARTIRQCHEPHRSILLACAAGEAPELEEGGRNAALHAALWSLARVDCQLSPAGVAQALALGGVMLDRDAEFADGTWWSERYETAAREIGVHRAAKALEDAEKGGEWVGRVARDKEGRVTANPGNVVFVLVHDPDVADALRWNTFSGQGEVPAGAELPWGAPGPRALDLEADWGPCMTWLRDVPRVGQIFSKGAVMDGLLASARARSYDPLEEYLRGLQWDGVPRIATWLHDWLGADDTELVRQMGRRWLISGVARGLDGGCQVDSVLVLQGEQGLGKSSAFRILAGDWYTDRIGDPHHKDSMQEIQGRWVVEIAELESMRKHDMATIKAFLTRTSDNYRASHARDMVVRPRRCVFGASTNADHYLADATGGRRWWCVGVHKALDQTGFMAIRDQLWAEAVHEYDRGESWHLTGWLQAQAMAEAEDRREDSPWEDAIQKWNPPAEGFTTGDLYAAMGVSKSDTRAGYQLRDALKVLGYVQTRPRDGGTRRKLWIRKPIK